MTDSPPSRRPLPWLRHTYIVPLLLGVLGVYLLMPKDPPRPNVDPDSIPADSKISMQLLHPLESTWWRRPEFRWRSLVREKRRYELHLYVYGEKEPIFIEETEASEVSYPREAPSLERGTQYLWVLYWEGPSGRNKYSEIFEVSPLW